MHRRRDAAAVAAAQVRRRHAQVRQRQARPALRPGDRRRRRHRGPDRVPGVSRDTAGQPAARCAASTPAGRPTSSRARTSTNWPRSSSGCGGKGCAWVKVEAEKFAGGIEKFLPAADPEPAARSGLDAKAGDLLLFVADKEDVVCQALGSTAAAPGHVSSSCSIRASATTRSPGSTISRRSSGTTRRNAGPRTIIRSRPRWTRTWHKLESDPGSVRAKAYDLVINGYECGGGSIRIHNPEVQAPALQGARHDRRSRPGSASASCSTP